MSSNVVPLSIPSPPSDWSVFYFGSWLHSWIPAWPAAWTLPIHVYALVILAGIDNGLRSQTQLRVDEGFLGFDTQYQQRYDDDRRTSYMGVGALPGAARLKGALAPCGRAGRAPRPWA